MPVATVTVAPSSASVAVGGTVALGAMEADADGNILKDRVVTWSSDHTSVATVNSIGVVSAIAAGTATLMATSEGISGTSAITVTSVPVASITVSPTSASVAAGATRQLTASPK
ncbi:MAG: Ig-like domain-containing protein, partial [Candidatus Eiseniibacteriota bacterium]